MSQAATVNDELGNPNGQDASHSLAGCATAPTAIPFDAAVGFSYAGPLFE